MFESASVGRLGRPPFSFRTWICNETTLKLFSLFVVRALWFCHGVDERRCARLPHSAGAPAASLNLSKRLPRQKRRLSGGSAGRGQIGHKTSPHARVCVIVDAPTASQGHGLYGPGRAVDDQAKHRVGVANA